MELQNKTLCFLGDSLTASGIYPQDVRAYLKNQGIHCRVFNRGLGGNRAPMVKYLLEAEIDWLKPDYVFISFGVNDLGIWMYDSKKPITPELLKQREERNQLYYASMEEIIVRLKERGITTVVTSPFAVDELLIEREDIETVGDNKEKADYIGPSFYKRATFRNLNVALKEYAENLKILAERHGVLFCDIFTDGYTEHLKTPGMFKKDGIHITEQGCRVFAKSVLKFLGFTDFAEENFALGDGMEEYYVLERLERKAQYFRWAWHNPFHGEWTQEDVKKEAEAIVANPAAANHHKEAANAYIEHGATIQDLQKRLYEENEKLMKD